MHGLFSSKYIYPPLIPINYHADLLVPVLKRNVAIERFLYVQLSAIIVTNKKYTILREILNLLYELWDNQVIVFFFKRMIN